MGGASLEKVSISKATLGRIPRYLNCLKELSPDKVPYISATTISKALNLGEVQVRKDLAMVSGAGRPRLGYDIEMLMGQLEDCLGYNKLTRAVLVGAGRLGRALLQYDGFEHFGVKIMAAFDSNDRVINLDSKTEILPMNQFDSFCKEHNIRIGIITVGEGSAQAVCDQMVKSGITAIWNFAPCKLQVPEGVLLQNENLALSLAHLRNQLSRHKANS
jgi:redox-sensing transcriptional repressor